MEFKIAETIGHPLEAVYATYRDRLPELVPYLPNVDRIEVRQRSEGGGRVRQLNHWAVSGSVPAAVRPFFPARAMEYLDHAEWVDAEHLVHWRLEMGIFPDAVQCRGTNYFRELEGGSASEILLTGRLDVDLARVPGVPRLLRGLAPRVEGFVLERVKPNLSSVAAAVGKFLNDLS